MKMPPFCNTLPGHQMALPSRSSMTTTFTISRRWKKI
ncbi:unnamed protein product [Acanthoscelides obtectus]|uniref:Uncharacterized protein n=1 Tax=Acanthoscelides obtectus TaxID=200917 RepID=A0A9P0LMK6_ACAOB|nr:unnamed protein product [Acanthoscelides obtectus]CAK1677879.1 hypothetical protein AOBTE_LOCUS31611 [Acanthoscelides obtectus]